MCTYEYMYVCARVAFCSVERVVDGRDVKLVVLLHRVLIYKFYISSYCRSSSETQS